MSNVAILDTACLLWDINDYINNSYEYLTLKNRLINLFDLFNEERPYVLLRGELVEEIIESFPFNELPSHFHDYTDAVFRFIINTPAERIVQCQPTNSGVSSNPVVVKNHFTNNGRNEVLFILSHIHQTNSDDNCYFAYPYLYLSTTHLVTSLHQDNVTCNTVFFDDETVLINYFEQFKKIFEPNPVHHTKNKKNSKKSRLRCYNGNDTNTPQEYLNRSIYENNRYYFYDPINEVYVVFLRHQNNKYHGHEEEDFNKIPDRVKNHFNVR